MSSSDFSQHLHHILTTYSLQFGNQVVQVVLIRLLPELIVSEFISLLLLVEHIILGLRLSGLLQVTNQAVLLS